MDGWRMYLVGFDIIYQAKYKMQSNVNTAPSNICVQQKKYLYK
jgi:hypothetical protein